MNINNKILMVLIGFIGVLLGSAIIGLSIALIKLTVKHRAKRDALRFLSGEYNLTKDEIRELIHRIEFSPNMGDDDRAIIQRLKLALGTELQ